MPVGHKTCNVHVVKKEELEEKEPESYEDYMWTS
jgi:hypothetical protein